VALGEDQKAMLRLLAQREDGYEDIAALSGGSVEEVRAKVKEALAGLDGSLGEDQQAILRLLAQREQGYGDIAALMGLGVEDVRARVKAVVAGLAEAGGQASPEPAPEPAPSPAPKPPEPEPSPPAAEAKAASRSPESDSTPSLPSARAKSAGQKAGGLRMPEDRGAMRALLAGAAVVLVIVLLLVTGVLGGSDDGGAETTASGGGGGGTNTAANNGKAPTEAVLRPVAGGDASGRALFGRSGQDVVMLFNAEGLPKAPKGQSYTVSLVRSANQRLPLIATEANDTGVISGRFQVAAEVLGLLAGGFDTMELSLVPAKELRAALAQARTAKKAPDYEGTAVLEGPVTGPIVEAGKG
jgi:hypothetical protein